MSIKRVTASAASLGCKGLNTKSPVKDAGVAPSVGGCLSPARGTCHEDDSIGPSEQLFETKEHLLSEPQIFQFDQRAGLVQQSEDHIFSINGWKGRNPDLETTVLHFDIEVSILGEPGFSNVHLRQDLNPGGEGGMDGPGKAKELV